MPPRLSNPEKIKEKSWKRAEYERLCGGKPDAIYILGHDVVKNTKTGEYKSGSYSHIDPLGRIGGAKARSIAGAELHRFFPQARIATSGWSLQQDEYVSHAHVTAGELRKRDVPNKKIIIKENPPSTFIEIIELVTLIVRKGWRRVAVLSNEFQIPRAQAMLENIQTLRDPKGIANRPRVRKVLSKFAAMHAKVTFVSAEHILPVIDKRFQKVIDSAKNLPAWKTIVEKEQEGARQVRSGEYWKGKN